jgi:hypothetical protein
MGRSVIELSSTSEALAALGRARRISIDAYTLHGPVLRAAEQAARRGARVVVRLAGDPHDDARGRLARENARIAGELRAAGAEAALEPSLHAKTIVADGALYLDGKNWHAGDVVLRDADQADAAIAASKSAALSAEAELLNGARNGDGVVVESESFGCCNVVYGALQRLARSGASPRLLVSARDLRGNERERRALERLERGGVRVRVCYDSEKLAVCGDRAWIGSANATCAYGKFDMRDWGVAIADAAIATAVRTRLEAEWRGARELRMSSQTVR